MQLGEFIDKLSEYEQEHGNEALVVVVTDGLPPLAKLDLKREVHHDADGSTTVWIEASE